MLKTQACVRACGDVVADEEEEYEDEFFSCVWVSGSSADKDDTFSLTHSQTDGAWARSGFTTEKRRWTVPCEAVPYPASRPTNDGPLLSTASPVYLWRKPAFTFVLPAKIQHAIPTAPSALARIRYLCKPLARIASPSRQPSG